MDIVGLTQKKDRVTENLTLPDKKECGNCQSPGGES